MKKAISIFLASNIFFTPCSFSVAIATLLIGSIPNKAIGQEQPPLSVEHSAVLKKAEQLYQEAGNLYDEGKYIDPLPLAERSLVIREEVLGKGHIDVAKSLNRLATLYFAQGNYQKAEPLYQRALGIRESLLGKKHPDVADSLNNLGSLYFNQGKYQQSEEMHKRALAIREKVLGKEHLDVTQSLINLGLIYYRQGNYNKAKPLYLRALIIREKVLGKKHLLVASILSNLGILNKEQGDYKKAEYQIKQALEIREELLGKEHPDVAKSLNSLAEFYRTQGNYKKAEELHQHALAIREKVLGKEHPDVAESLNNLGGIYQVLGKSQEVEKLYQRMLAIREKVFGKEHLLVAQSYNNIADFYAQQSQFDKAEKLYLRALEIREKLLGKESLDATQSFNNLAELYRLQGKYQQAEKLYQSALLILNKMLPEGHPFLLATRSNLAGLYLAQGNYRQGEQLLQRNLAIEEELLGKEHPDVAQSLNNLAIFYQLQSEDQKAEEMYQRVLKIREKVLGKDHPLVARSLGNLAILYQAHGKYQQSEEMYRRALKILDKALGKEHPDVAKVYYNLAVLYREMGDEQNAQLLYQRALAIQENQLGKEHPDVVQSLKGLTGIYLAQGNIARAADFFNNVLAIEEKNLQLIYAVGSEQRKQNYWRTFIGTTYGAVSLVFQEGKNNPVIANLALTTVLRRKGRVLDAVTDSVQILRAQLEANPETKKLFDKWLSIQKQLSAQVFQELGKQTPEQYKARIEQLETERQSLEAAISEKSVEFRQEIQPVELKAIQAKIPKNAALVEIIQYQPFNYKARKKTEEWSKPRYAAVVLHSQGEPKWVDLGETATIDTSVNNLINGLKKSQIPTQQVQQAARALDEQLMKPIRPLLGNASHILLSPDGQLTLLPFEALVDEQGQYLIQRYAFSYLTTGRDLLLRFESPATSRSSPVVLADIDYGQVQTVKAIAKPTGSSQNLRSNDFANKSFDSLAATKAEAVAIKDILPNFKMFLGKDATETAVKQLQAPSILHLATHGFFLSDQEINLSPSSSDLIGQPNPKVWQLENPLLRSGLALANINNRSKLPTGSNDGVLTALEVAGLNLRGTQLVVMSACDTGKGDVKVGEGVYGLRRALVIAGSQSQVLSLWKVSDEATKELMVKYYSKLKAGKARHEALREAQLEMLNSQDYQHPFFWAAFVPSGDWSPLNNR
jgi:CHAT domain-containing protein/Tfp pilus assembly protein PilF